MKTQLLILACSSFILFGCNKNTASQHSKDTTETQAASAPATIDPDRQQLMDELAEYKDNPIFRLYRKNWPVPITKC